MTVFANISEGKDVDIQDAKFKDTHAKYETLLKEYDLLKEKLDAVTKELSDEKEKKKTSSGTKTEDRGIELQNSKSIFL